MNYKNIIIISILLLVLSVAAVSASDSDNNYVAESSYDGDSFAFIEIDESNDLSASVGTFENLQKEINDAPAGSVLNLTRDYAGHQGAVVHIERDIIIDGQGHTIDCLGKECSAFYSGNGNIVLKNLNIINGNNNNHFLDIMYHGGAIRIEGSAQYTIENCSFINNWADDHGGAIYNGVNKALRIINCQFTSNALDDGDGGAIYSVGDLFVENSYFYNNMADNYGGAIYTQQTLTVKNSKFVSNKADDDDGGAIYSIGETNIYDSTFENNVAEDSGGAIYSIGKTNIYDSTFERNTVKEDGGAICAKNELYVNKCSFSLNEAEGDGGAIYIDNGNEVTFESCYFSHNFCEGDGGSIYSKRNIKLLNSNFDEDGFITIPITEDDGSKHYIYKISHDGGSIYCEKVVNVDNCTFIGSKIKISLAGTDGGAIYAEDDVNINNCLFNALYVSGCGAAIYSEKNVNINLNQDISDKYTTTFDFCSAVDDGGAIYAKGSVNAINTNFIDNIAFAPYIYDDDPNDDYGGAIYSKSTTNFNHCFFKGNEASDGGGVYSSDTVTANNCKFFNNRGGGIYAYCDAYVTDCEFSYNCHFNEHGGAIHCRDNGYVVRCTFLGNFADMLNDGDSEHTDYYSFPKGGAIYCKDDLTVDNCYFEGNHIQYAGGAIYADTLTLKQTPSYFKDNWADYEQGGAIWVNKFNENVKYATFIGNHAGEHDPYASIAVVDDGGAIYIDNGNEVTFESCCFINNHCGDEGGAIYLDSAGSKLSLINNIFIGNNALKEGTAVFNCGDYGTVKNNWWGQDFPDFNNVLVEWVSVGSNKNHGDEDPLRSRLTIGAETVGVNSSVNVQISLISVFDSSIRPKLTGLENFIFTSNHLGEYPNYYYGDNDLEATYTPKEEGIHQISVNLFNKDKNAFGYLNVNNSAIPVEKQQVIMNTDLFFTHFQKMVNNAEDGAVLHLNNNFIYGGGDFEFIDKEGILINKNLVIDGHGHSFDAKSMSGIFQSSTGSFTLRNIVFKNGNQEYADDGGAIRILGDAEYTIINCTFDSNKALQDGGAIYNEGKDLMIRDCTFVNNRAEGANKLNDCDGGAIHSKAYTYIRNSVFKNNFANDNGGAVYATGGLQLSTLNPCYFEANTANKGKGGAIYTDYFTTEVKYASFIANRAGDGALISDDGGAIYINEKNEITFDSCLFANNHCTDEGGAIYLDSTDSKLSLINNIFIGNAADDEGQTVYNKGNYGTVNNNFWGGNNPAIDNDQLIEWRPLMVPNLHEVDKEPLTMDLVLSQQECPVNTTFEGNVHFYKSNGALFDGTITGIESITLSSSPNIDAMRKNNDKNTIYGKFTSDKEGKYTISANLFGYSISKSINVFEIKISASEVTTFTNVPVTFKVHLEGDKQHTANQKVRVSFFKDYDLVTDANGDAIVTFDDYLNLDVGKYRVDISSNGFTAQSAVNIITTIFAEDVVQVRGDHVEFKAQFINNSGDFLKKSTQVQLLLDENPCYSIIKDNEGNALFEFNSLSRGEHKVVVINPDNGEMKSYRIVILMGFGATKNVTNNQNQKSQKDAPYRGSDNSDNSDIVNTDSLNGDVNRVSLDNDNTTNQSASSSVSKAIDNPQTNSGDSNLWWIILAIIAIIAVGGIIKKYKS